MCVFLTLFLSVCFCLGPGECGEGADLVWPAAHQEALPFDIHPNPGGTKVSDLYTSYSSHGRLDLTAYLSVQFVL